MVPRVEEVRTRNLYVGAAPGCFVAYTELLGRELGNAYLAESRMLALDVYMAQHPGVPGRQSSQSVWVHLVGLCLVLEHDFDGLASARAKARLAAPNAVFDWLAPPATLGPITVLDVLALESPESHRDGVDRWARAVWQAWAPHHGAIRQRAAEIAGLRG
jgi:hypothetical protein